jgi:methionyl-tRNA formyltransferase
VKATAVRHQLPVFQPDKLREPAVEASLRDLGADLGVVAAYGKLIPDRLLSVPRHGMINVHASLLPRYRGAAPVHRAIIAGERETGVTIMRVVKALDAGPMLSTVRRTIGPDDTSEDVERDLGRLGAQLLVSTADALASGHAQETPQDEAAANYAHRLTKDDGVMDWRLSAEQLHNLVRGLHPWPHAYTFHQGHRFILHRSMVIADGAEGSTAANGAGNHAPGAILEAHGDRLVVATGAGRLQVTKIQAEGKRPMTVREFLAGHRLIAGDRFGPESPIPNS